MGDSAPAPTPLQNEPLLGERVSLSACLLTALAVAVGLALALSTCSKPLRPAAYDPAATPSVGAEALYTLLLSRGDITAAEKTDNAPLFVRIKSIQH
jgi:hypothetical protein